MKRIIVAAGLLFVALVSSRASAGRFVVEGEGMVRDTVTGLVWQQYVAKETCKGCTPIAAEIVKETCDSLPGNGLIPWRAPTYDDINTIKTFDSPPFYGPTDSKDYRTNSQRAVRCVKGAIEPSFKQAIETKKKHWKLYQSCLDVPNGTVRVPHNNRRYTPRESYCAKAGSTQPVACPGRTYRSLVGFDRVEPVDLAFEYLDENGGTQQVELRYDAMKSWRRSSKGGTSVEHTLRNLELCVDGKCDKGTLAGARVGRLSVEIEHRGYRDTGRGAGLNTGCYRTLHLVRNDIDCGSVRASIPQCY